MLKIAQVLTENDYPVDFCARVERCIRSHSTPVHEGKGTPEEVCLSNADAMSQITHPAYWLFFAYHIRKYEFAEGRDWLLARVESNWEKLIPPARNMIDNHYRFFRDFLN